MAIISQSHSIYVNIVHVVHALPGVSKLLDHQNAVLPLGPLLPTTSFSTQF